MKKFAVYLEYFKKYAAEYNFDYLMIVALGYQESQLDQSKRSRNGAVGIMQVIPTYAAASPSMFQMSAPRTKTSSLACAS